MKFKKDVLQELAWYDKGDNFDGFEVMYTKQVDTSRWSIIHEQVFSFDGKFYKTIFRTGATEYQDEMPYNDENDWIEIDEVYPKEISTTIYVTKENI